MSRIMKAMSIVLMVAMCLTTICSSTAFAAELAEAEEMATVRLNETVNTEEDGITIETSDPNIVIRVIPITEDTPMPMNIRGVHTTVDYTASFKGKWRTYEGNHFSVDIKTESETRNGRFVMKLVRKTFPFNDVVGKVELPRNGSFHVEFLNIYKPNQEYRLEFEQTGGALDQQHGVLDIWDWD